MGILISSISMCVSTGYFQNSVLCLWWFGKGSQHEYFAVGSIIGHHGEPIVVFVRTVMLDDLCDQSWWTV